MRGQPTRTRQCRRCKERKPIREYDETGNQNNPRRQLCKACVETREIGQECNRCGKWQLLERFVVLDVRDKSRSKICNGCRAAALPIRSERVIMAEREEQDRAWVREGWDALRRNREEAQR